ncbi:SDR family oxidoreductase [Paenibacillus sp. HN-1]|uniref:SDR family NAD(P)-dependent oxidoreductase n=1 Tax=Paenibacillus TaxID=44249 RepID=UPI001CA9CBB0|nr:MULTISPECIES: SDR family oxidoreductase [Paenibacillus]MBY9080272.1 SDR family oxidoreductase [Paenibacillus sp. CGMCC 1.18879]MBY9083069.1 SDR family oxidoreductase [Paenibacillus sinensis]
MANISKVIITGAASGIGRAVAQVCLREGMTVLACDLNGELLKELKCTEGAEGKVYTDQLDISRYEEVCEWFDSLYAQHPDVDGLVNNAGIYLAKNLLDYRRDEIDRVLDVNIKGAVYCSQLFGGRLLEERRAGAIVNLSSVSGMEGSSDAVYGLSKAAILGLTKSCAMNFSPYIRVNAVAPTMVETAMMDAIPDWRKKEYLSHQLVPSPVLPEDVAESVLFLLSDKSRHYTGATFDINNGCYLR